MNYTKCTMFGDSSRRQCLQDCAGWCGQQNCHSCHKSGNNVRLVAVCVDVCVSIVLLIQCPSMRLPLVPPTFQMKWQCLALWTITCSIVFDCCIYLSVWIKVTIVLGFHLSQTIVRTIACSVWPAWFLSDDCIEALEFLVDHYSWMCIDF